MECQFHGAPSSSEEDLVPTYQYACSDCGHRFEAVQKFTDDSLTVCPECGGVLRKIYGSVGVVFKGSGWYRTDSRSGPAVAAAPGGAKAEGGAKSDSGGDGKSTSSGSDKGSGSGGASDGASKTSSPSTPASTSTSGSSTSSSTSSSSGSSGTSKS